MSVRPQTRPLKCLVSSAAMSWARASEGRTGLGAAEADDESQMALLEDAKVRRPPQVRGVVLGRLVLEEMKRKGSRQLAKAPAISFAAEAPLREAEEQPRYSRSRTASLPDVPRPPLSNLKKAKTESFLERPKVLRFSTEVEVKELSPLLQPKPFGAPLSFWQGGDAISDAPQGSVAKSKECLPEVVKAMKACLLKTGTAPLIMAGVSKDDPNQMLSRKNYVIAQFAKMSESCKFLADGYTAVGIPLMQLLNRPAAEVQRGHAAFVEVNIPSVISAQGRAWQGSPKPAALFSFGMNALRLPAYCEELGHSNVILAGGGSFAHKDGPKAGAISCRQAEEAWKQWKAGQFGDVSLSDAVILYAKTHAELKGAFLTFPNDADDIYPGWKKTLGYESFRPPPPAATAPVRVAPPPKSSTVARSHRQPLDEKALMKDGRLAHG